jgi:hypothetical protein
MITDHVWRASPNAVRTDDKISCAYWNCRRPRHEHARRVKPGWRHA